ncbi:GL15027 [Drosophila persimilis]|uniref:GL15027 n=1 Tax=Drosophila persimilis TaxID=7234 RepID=B4H0P5_DROPE|nr:GL15027 [Drosophila persimilis]
MSLLVEYTDPRWRGLNMRALAVDQAYMYLRSEYGEPSYLYTLSDECYTCPYTKVKALPAAGSGQQLEPLQLSTEYALNFKIFQHDQGRYAHENVSALCWLRRTDLQEFGVYNLTLLPNGTCDFAVDKPGVPINYAFLSVFVLVAAVLILLKLGSCAWRCYRYDEAAAAADSIGAAATKATQRKRLRSLDTFRGLSIVLMIFVNSGGGGYAWIEHAAWNGLHLADLVFPFLPVDRRSWHRAIYRCLELNRERAQLLAEISSYPGVPFNLRGPVSPRGYSHPGGKHDQGAHSNCTPGAAGYVDMQVEGNAHIYPASHSQLCVRLPVPSIRRESFGCLLSIVQVLLGAFAGLTLLVHTTWQTRLRRWLLLSLLLGVVGGALCGFSREGGVIPVNKNLWSLSFVFVTVSVALLLLALLYYIIDVRDGWWSGWPFSECGMNAIIMYVGHSVLHKMLPWHWRLGPMNTHFVLLLESTWNTLLWVGIALYLDAHEFYYSL